MAKKHDERDGDGKFVKANRDNAGYGPGAIPPTIRGTQVEISGEPGSGGGPKAMGDQNTYARGSEHGTNHDYDVFQQDRDKARSR
jgi:hypothetical protein